MHERPPQGARNQADGALQGQGVSALLWCGGTDCAGARPLRRHSWEVVRLELYRAFGARDTTPPHSRRDTSRHGGLCTWVDTPPPSPQAQPGGFAAFVGAFAEVMRAAAPDHGAGSQS